MTATGTYEHRGFAFRYGSDRTGIPKELASRFLELDLDDETRQFIDAAIASRHGWWTDAAHSLLGRFLSDFDVNGLLGTYPLFLLSPSQWKELLAPTSRGRLLDVGAGSGDVTARFASLFDDVTVTETSGPMVRRLQKRFRAHHVDLATEDLPEPGYDVITCLNVLDRCARPQSLLRRLVDLLGPSGHLVLSTPLPFDPFVYQGGSTREPDEALGVVGKTWEASLASLVTKVLEPLGLSVVRFSRAPYLSGGDRKMPLYQLDDAVLLCRPSAAPSSPRVHDPRS
jgi:2-polyprenyl-3-methyl-5-hydroxy-6-metoxy-1,4-benzoquinol methylase